MSQDLVVLVPQPPDVSALLAGMAAAGEELLVLPVGDGVVIQLCDAPDGETLRPLLTVEAPVMVPVPGEVARLLDDGIAGRVPSPVWWLELRAAGEPEFAVELARRFAGAIVDRFGGEVWQPAVPAPAGVAGVASPGPVMGRARVPGAVRGAAGGVASRPC